MSIMKKPKNIIQFTPYFPPHIWGVEKVAEEILSKWTYWKSSLYSWNKWQDIDVDNTKNKKNKSIDNNGQNIFFPSFDIVDNFPVPRFWTQEYRDSKNKLQEIIKSSNEDTITITHTRFFLSTLIWGRFAKKHNLRWIHIEHGGQYVKLSSSFKSFIARIYDRTIWKWVFQNADSVLAISQTVKNFVQTEFARDNVEVWYRGLDIPDIEPSTTLRDMFPDKIILWYLGRLSRCKNVESLCKAYLSLPKETRQKTQLVIIWWWEDFSSLRDMFPDSGIYFAWPVPFDESLSLQWEFDIHIHPSSPGWWLATTLLQAMHHWPIIVATPFEWGNEVIHDGINGYLLADDSAKELSEWILRALWNMDTQEIFAQKNKQILREQFSLEKNLEKLYRLL